MTEHTMALFSHGRMSKEDVSFCNCARIGKGKECRCGEDERNFTWLWDPYSTQSDITLQDDDREVIFHANYSSGTAAIRGNTPFREGHHFWEIKMTTPVYGTDMMVGVATADLDLDKYIHTFCSLLGRDSQSWGLSYLGTLHHRGQSRTFSDKLGQGAIVGIHLDMWLGTLSFYVNRQPLGVAFRGLQGKTLYPVVTSTAARSGMKVITTKWFPHSLQFQCCQTLRSYVQRDKYVLDAICLPPGLNVFLENNLGWLLRSFPPPAPLWCCGQRPCTAVSESRTIERGERCGAQFAGDTGSPDTDSMGATSQESAEGAIEESSVSKPAGESKSEEEVTSSGEGAEDARESPVNKRESRTRESTSAEEEEDVNSGRGREDVKLEDLQNRAKRNRNVDHGFTNSDERPSPSASVSSLSRKRTYEESFADPDLDLETVTGEERKVITAMTIRASQSVKPEDDVQQVCDSQPASGLHCHQKELGVLKDTQEDGLDSRHTGPDRGDARSNSGESQAGDKHETFCRSEALCDEDGDAGASLPPYKRSKKS